MEECLLKYWDTLNEYIQKYAPKTTKYDWDDFQKDLSTYKTIGLVLATTLMPNVLSGTQVEAGGIMALREMQRKQAAELEAEMNTGFSGIFQIFFCRFIDQIYVG